MESSTTPLPFDTRDGKVIRCNLRATPTELEPVSVQPVSSLYDVVTETPRGFSHPVTVLKGKKLTWWPVSNLPIQPGACKGALIRIDDLVSDKSLPLLAYNVNHNVDFHPVKKITKEEIWDKCVKVAAIARGRDGVLFILVNYTGDDEVLPVGDTEWHIIHEQDEAIFKQTQEEREFDFAGLFGV
jgi:hypothetical protein